VTLAIIILLREIQLFCSFLIDSAVIVSLRYFNDVVPEFFLFEISKHPAKDLNESTFNMGQPSTQASNAIIYLSYGAFLYASTTCLKDLSDPFAIRHVENSD